MVDVDSGSCSELKPHELFLWMHFADKAAAVCLLEMPQQLQHT